MQGRAVTPSAYACLSETIHFVKPLTLFAPVTLDWGKDARLYATPLQNNGSGDFVSVGDADGFIELPASESEHQAGGCFPLFGWSVL